MKAFLSRCFSGEDRRRQILCMLGIAMLLAATLYGRIILANSPRPVHLVVYGFSSQQEVMTQIILPEFERAWEAETGRDLIVESLFGPSATLAGQINLGAPADLVLFSNAQHVEWLKFGRRVRRETEPTLLGYTPMVIVVRHGNPAGISGFEDLAQPGLRLLHADPRTSGAGEWAVLAEYGSALRESSDEAAAKSQLHSIWQNVRLLAPSARSAMTLFELGVGDALITYEQEALLALDRGVPLEIVTPTHTILAEHVAVPVDDNVTSVERPVVQQLLSYLTGAGQLDLSAYYLRTPGQHTGPFQDLLEPFVVKNLGGWSQAYTGLVETLWMTELEPRLSLEPAPRLLGSGGD
jgi:ABC-type sulfate transport system substrate-binding protein